MKRFIKITCMCLALTMLLSMFLGNKQVGTMTNPMYINSGTKDPRKP